MNTGDTAFVLLCSALVLLMTPGLGFFYGGMVRGRNVLNTLMMSFIAMAVVGVTWVLWGYSLAFAPNTGPLAAVIGSGQWFGLGSILTQTQSAYAGNIPHLAYVAFQSVFAMITPALISGAIVERVSFKGYVWFTLLWSLAIYAPIAHWVWGEGGWLRTLGALDFAGGTVVHISAGVSALVAALILGPRQHRFERVLQGTNVPFVLLGGAMLWFGWFGFNAGSALGANAIAALAFITTNTAAAAGACAWMLVDGTRAGKVSVVGGANGAVAGLVAVTPAAGFVSPLAALLIGAVSALGCYVAASCLNRSRRLDDSLDAFSIHGVGGVIGAIATGVFATKLLNPAGADGLLAAGNTTLLGIQLLAVTAVGAYAAFGSYIILKILDATVRLRVTHDVEVEGLDIHHHGESVYRGTGALTT